MTSVTKRVKKNSSDEILPASNDTVEQTKAGDVIDTREKLQEVMIFLGAITSGLEHAVGESANKISYLAGVNLGKSLSLNAGKTSDIVKALEITRKVLSDNNYLWYFEEFKMHDRQNMVQITADGAEVMLVFRDCMIRQSLFRFAHAQKGSLCNMMFGFFSGALKNIMGCESTLEIVHAGENACYKRLIVKTGGLK